MKGFTLIETIMAILVLSIAFLGLVAVVIGVFTNATHDEAMTIATMLAKGEMERVMGLSFANVDDENEDSPVAFTGNFSNYSWEVIVSAVPVAIASDPTMTNYKQVEAMVTNAIAGDINLKTIVTNY